MGQVMATQGSQNPEPSLVSDGATPIVSRTLNDSNATVDFRPLYAIGDYRLLEEVGHGGMGVVFKAQHLTNGAVVALKTIRMDKDVTARTVQRFEREIEAAR